jgi:integrase/recombinase XerD
MTPIAPLITSFLQDYMPRQRGYSLQTCETYAVSFKLLLEYAATRTGTRPSRLAIEQLDAPLIVAFLAYIEQERGNGAATRNLRLAAIRSFMRYVEHHVPSALAQVGRIEAIPVKRRDQKLIRHLTMEEIRAILNAPDLTTRLGVRDRAMMHLCFAGGLRVSELVGVLQDNITLGRTPTVMVRGKGRKERCLPLWKETARDVRAWQSVRGEARTPELFVNAEGAAMTRAGFEYVLDKHVRRAAKIYPALAGRTVSPHQLRHSCAVVMLQATRDIRKVALWLGHADIRTTEVLSPHGSQREAGSS